MSISNYILLVGTAVSVFSPTSIFNTWLYPNQLIGKIIFLGNIINSYRPGNSFGSFITRANPKAYYYFTFLIADSIILGPENGLQAQLSKTIAFIKDRFPTPVQIPVNPVPNPPIIPTLHSGPSVNPLPTTPVLNVKPAILPSRYTGPIVNPFPTTSGLNDAPAILPTRYTGPIFNPFPTTSGLNDAPAVLPTRYTGPIVNPFPTTSCLNDAPAILPTRYTGPIVNPFPTICGLDEQPITPPSLPQSSSLLPIIGAVAVAAVLGYVAYRWVQQGRTIESIQKIAEPVVPIKEEPVKIEPELNEIQAAAASFTDTSRYLVTRYSISSARFTKAAMINLIRSIKYIALSILFIPALVTQSGRLNFKSNCAQILPSLRQTFISLAGIPCPPLAVNLL